MIQKFPIISIWFSCTLLCFNANSQVTNDSSSPPITRSYFESKKILGYWYMADSTDQRAEFVDEGYQITLKGADRNPYYFSKDSTGHIYSSGYFPMWPPPGCDLELISDDSLNITFSPFFTPGKPILYLRKKNEK